MFSQFKHPSVEIPKLIEARTKDIDTLIDATRAVLDGAQSLTAKQADMLRHAVDELSAMMKQVSASAGAAGHGARISAELLQQTVHTGLQSMSDLVRNRHEVTAHCHRYRGKARSRALGTMGEADALRITGGLMRR